MVLIKSKLLHLVESDKGGAPPRGGLLARAGEHCEDEAERGTGGRYMRREGEGEEEREERRWGRKGERLERILHGACFFFAGGYHTSGQVVCADLSQN